MALDLSGFSSVTNSVNGIAGLALVTPNAGGFVPQKTDANPNPGSTFMFHYEGQQSITLESDITDEVAEDNTSLQDNIALRPVQFNTMGYIGELNNILPTFPGSALVQQAVSKLPALGAYAPGFSKTATNAISTAQQAYQTGASAVSSVQTTLSTLGLKKNGPQNKQQAAFATFFGFWKTRTLFTIQTPWVLLKDMAIRSIRTIQDEDTNVVSSFEVSFKQMKFASTTVGGLDKLVPIYSGRSANQFAPTNNQGTGRLGPDVPFVDTVA